MGLRTGRFEVLSEKSEKGVQMFLMETLLDFVV